MGLFGFGKKPEAPKPKTLLQMNDEELKAAKKEIADNMKVSKRENERQIFQTQMLVKNAQKQLETAIKKGEDKNLQRAYAKNLMQARKVRDRQMVNKTKIQDVEFTINDLFAQIKMTKTMGNCTAVIQKVNSLCNIQEIASVGAELQKNLNKMGVVSELVEDAMESMDDDGDMDDDVAVNTILDEIQEKVAPKAYKNGTPLQQQEEEDDITAQLNGLKI